MLHQNPCIRLTKVNRPDHAITVEISCDLIKIHNYKYLIYNKYAIYFKYFFKYFSSVTASLLTKKKWQ